ncbi:unnamed protein product (macronuclear) [Paramecium tetraurelia]|uniref:B box-type domain-containing protein n=1 Tax=Paramecium tetraurelia TaxID=5888 RepID=A0DK82_PARTE|nr:uncharacterized protein GSPATT00017778001 [Paramecium tetraurelia]CAK83449.1 unnamed protein product [Paramecium tetraurelia]|eukprot:XP_001450846.1 hypothetical protein (macronuclear) [Paramecium tetraurelia strain d4-2]
MQSRDEFEEQEDMIIEENFIKNVGSNQNQRFESDFTVEDQDKRNILHQTALRQDNKVLEILIEDYKILLKDNKKKIKSTRQQKKQIPQKNEDDEEIIEIDFDFEDNDGLEVQEQIKKYVQQKDIFGCSPIQICCFLNDPKLQNNRQECLRILIENGSDVNCINPHSRWAPLHWCAFYGDSYSVQFLLKKKAHTFLCDNNGLYPMDLAGKNGHENVLRLIIKQTIDFLTECQQFWNSELKGKNEAEFIQLQEICSKHEPELQNPLLYTKVLYWCCFYSINKDIQDILRNLPRIYIMFPIKSLEGQSCLHACCSKNNYDALKIIIKSEILDLSIRGPESTNKKKPQKKYRDRKNYYSKALVSYLETISRQELPGITYILDNRDSSIYKERYYHELERYRMQDLKYKEELLKITTRFLQQHELKNDKEFYNKTKELFCKNVLQIDVKDNHGNTALHLASLNGDQKIIKFLLNKYADPEAENNEFFRARQLTKDTATQIYYDGLIKKKKYAQNQNLVHQSIAEIFDKHKQKRQKQLVNFEDQYNLMENIVKKSQFYKSQLKTKKQIQAQKSIREQKSLSQFNENELQKSPDSIKSSVQRENKNFLHKTAKAKKNNNQVIPLNVSTSLQQKKKTNSFDCLEQLILFSSQLFVPDIVLKFDQSVKTNLIDIFKRHKGSEIEEQKRIIDQQINFQLDLLQKAEFEIYMMQSFIAKESVYIMLRLKEEKLERLAEEMEMQIKLIDSYDLEQFKSEQRNKFEPFRSSQRQKIVYDHLIKSVNLESLLKSKLVESCYAMHTSGGIQIVKRQWQKLSFGFIPQPISQIKDYLSEGRGRNFTSLTTMRLYFGEQISFYFAWISYLSCVQLIIAIPGLALQLYAILYDFHSDLIPYWVLFVTIWSTVQIELWKRKTSEINTRWGCIDQMLQAESSYYEGPLKDKFSGDEEIHFITRKLTKHQQITKMAVYFILFIFLLAVFLFCSFAIVYGIDLLKQELIVYKGFIFLLGALQAIAIQILNILFLYFSKWYADQENHKFELSYQKSLIYKNVFFRFINSYMPLMYIIVTSNKYTLEDIFYFIIPLVLVKKAYYILVSFLIPVILLRGSIRSYFKKVKDITIEQKKVRQTNKQHLLYLDEIEQFWDYDEFLKNSKLESQDNIDVDLLESAARPVLKIESEEVLEEKILEETKNPKFKYMPFETKIDVDAIELNSLKDDFEGTLDYFMEAITDYGYFILFSAAFPIGPFVGIVMNTIDIQVKLYKLIYMTKRVKSERVPGIGQWLNVLEFLSATGVFTNFVLLYFKHRYATLRMFTDQVDYVIQNDLELWYFMSCVIAVSLIKILVRELIPDRPDWVIEEIDKINHRELVEQQQKTQIKLKDLEKHYKELKEDNKKLKKEQGEMEYSTEIKLKQLDAEIVKLEQHFFSISKYRKLDRIVMTEYDMIVQSVMKIRYYQIDNALIVKRMLQFLQAKSQALSICQECGKNPTILECIECTELFCAACYQKLHTITQQTSHNVNLLIKKNEILEQIELNVVIDRPSQRMVPNELSKQMKSQIKITEPKRCWKKIEYFYIPLQLQNGQPKLNELYNQFGDYYLRGPGLEFRDFRIQVEKIVPIKELILIEDASLRIEDKIFLNRIAFCLFRKKKNLAEIQLFLKQCSTLQLGQLEQKVILFFDLLDLNEDEEISKDELENQFLLSFVQDVRTNKTILEMIDSFFTDKVKKREKKEITQEFFNKVQRNNDFSSFLESLLQVQGLKID